MPTRISTHRTSSAAHGGIHATARSTPPLDLRELDTTQAAIEVVIVWGGLSVLHVAHLSPPRAFYVGEREADFLLGRDTLGLDRVPIVLTEDGHASAVVPAAASGSLELAGDSIAFDALADQHQLRPVPGFAGARQVSLAAGACARIEHGDFTFIVREVSAARRVGLGMAAAERSFARNPWMLASTAAHLLLLVMFYILPPRGAAVSIDDINATGRLPAFAISAIERPDPPPQWLEPKTGSAAGGGARAAGPEGRLGGTDQAKAQGKLQVRARSDAPTSPVPSRGLLSADETLLNLLRSGAAQLPDSVFRPEQANAYDDDNTLAVLSAQHLGHGFGFGGLGANGTGSGGGGDARGTIGTGRLGTRGLGDGPGGDGSGYGGSAGGFHDRTARVPRIRPGTPDTFGSLSKEVIRRVINRHIAEVRHCYTQALISRPDLQGRLSVKFMIAPTGLVQFAATTPDSDLGHAGAAHCVEKAVRTWAFPVPEGGGLVVVTYPFLFSQAGN